ncbi:MAG: hypothetical protein EXS13_12145 [Planctomycetes bacterium]|nr:hypothetical protein [Planctomycetota bacterium]
MRCGTTIGGRSVAHAINAACHDRLLREQPALLERTVFVTGELASADAVRLAQRCRRPIVQKPFDYDELFAALTACAAQPARRSSG